MMIIAPKWRKNYEFAFRALFTKTCITFCSGMRLARFSRLRKLEIKTYILKAASVHEQSFYFSDSPAFLWLNINGHYDDL